MSSSRPRTGASDKARGCCCSRRRRSRILPGGGHGLAAGGRRNLPSVPAGDDLTRLLRAAPAGRLTLLSPLRHPRLALRGQNALAVEYELVAVGGVVVG